MKNYEGREVSINKEVIIKTKEKLNDFKQDVADYEITKTENEDLFKLLQRLYTIGDNLLTEFDEFISCQKGCSQCCDKLVYITELEGMMIKKFISNNFTQNEVNEIKTKVNNRIKIRNNIKPSQNYTDVINSHEKKLSCIFYSQTGLCEIYPLRPWNCRRHIVFSDKETCSLDNKKNPTTLNNTPFMNVKELIDDIEENLYMLNNTFKNENYYTLQEYMEERRNQ